MLQDAVGIKRGTKSILRAITVGEINIRDNFRNQVQELASDASKKDGMAGEKESHVWPSQSASFRGPKLAD
jgi:hypothetical protein